MLRIENASIYHGDIDHVSRGIFPSCFISYLKKMFDKHFIRVRLPVPLFPRYLRRIQVKYDGKGLASRPPLPPVASSPVATACRQGWYWKAATATA
jgi:hypothetical protein